MREGESERMARALLLHPFIATMQTSSSNERNMEFWFCLSFIDREVLWIQTAGTGGAASRDRIALAAEAREALLRRASQGTLNFHTTKQVCPSFSFFFNSFSSLLCLPYFCSIVCSWRSWMVETVPKEVVLALYVWIGQRIKRDAYQNITL